MPKAQKRRNPFTPGDGALPPYLAGREKEQAALLRMVQDVASGYVPPHNVLISAPRGNGKTVLLHWTANQAQLKDWDAMRGIQAALQASRHARLCRCARRHAPHQALGLCRAQRRPGPLAARHPQPDGACATTRRRCGSAAAAVIRSRPRVWPGSISRDAEASASTPAARQVRECSA